MKRVQKGATWFIKLHRRLIKPPYPVDIRCPSCGYWMMKVNSDIIEISNDFGLPPKELKAVDVWMRIKHQCGATINLYWNA